MANEGSKRLPSLRQRAIASAGIGTYRYTYEGVVERMDAVAFAIFGLEEHFKGPKEVAGRNLTELFEYLHPVGEGRQQVERFGRVHGLERQFNTLRGQRKWIVADLWQIEDQNGAPPLIEAVVRDITRRKLSEEALRASEERWQRLFHQEGVPKLILEADTGGIVDANAAAEAFYGWNRRELKARTGASLAEGAAEDAPPPAAEPPFQEQRHQRADGGSVPVVVHGAPIQWRDHPHILWTIRDISEREAGHRALKESETRFRRITEADADYIYRVQVRDGEAYATEHEPGCLMVTGYSSEEFRDDPFLWYAMVWEEDRGAVQAHAERVLAAEAFEPIEHRIVTKEGAVRWVRNTPAPEFDEAGRLVAYDGLIRDITEQRQAEEALRESGEHFRTVFETGYQAMYVLSEDLRILECNAAALAFHGMTREELMAAPVSRRMPPEAQEQMLHAFEVTARDGSWAGESERYGPEGEVLTVEAAVTRHYIRGQLHFLVSVHDITTRKQLEAELETIKETLDLTLDAVVMLDPGSLRFIYANRGAAELSGMRVDDLIGCTPLDLLPEFSIPEVRALLDSLRDGGQPTTRIETKALHADGHLVPVEIFLQYIEPPAGAGRFVAMVRDVSERLRVESILRQSEASLIRAQHIAHLGSWSHAAGSGVLQLSREARGILGQPEDCETAPFPEALEALVSPYDWHILKDALDVCLAKGVGFERELRITLPNGGERFVVWKAAPAKVDGDAVNELHGTVQDITERKRAEEERLKLEAKMRHAQKLESLGVLAGGIAHDFNNILTAILGNTGLLLEDMPADGPSRRRLGDIEEAARRAAYLAQQMLAYSGHGNFVIRLVDLNDIVRETAIILAASIPKSINLTLDYAESQPPVQADATQLSQLVMNLVTNAAEAIGGAQGSVTVRTGTVEIDGEDDEKGVEDEPIEAGKYVFLEVTDTGCGMSEDVKSRLFDPFFTTKFTGRGLGLAAVLGIVRAHYGALQVTSTPGEGTQFRILLPAAAGEATLFGGEIRPTADKFRGEGTVLLVDDEPALRVVGKRMLERLGFRVLTAEDGLEAIECFKQHQDEIVCILLDLVMPRMDGAEALQEILRLGPGVKVVLCSGYSREEISARFAGQRIAGVLHKPYQMQHLAAAMQKALAAK